MNPAPASVVRLEAANVATATGMLAESFKNDPLMTYCMPDAGRRQKGVPALYGGCLRYGMRYGEVWTTQSNGHPATAAAVWLPPGDTSPKFLREVRAGMISVPLTFGWTGFRRLDAFGAYSEVLHKQYVKGPHWYLWVLGVGPAFQGQGLSRRVLQPVFDKADQAGIPCYLETQKPANVPLYERLGFELLFQGPVPGHAITISAMARPAKRA